MYLHLVLLKKTNFAIELLYKGGEYNLILRDILLK